MSDYLNNLVARTLKLTPVVQPRLTSLFEPRAARMRSAAATLHGSAEPVAPIAAASPLSKTAGGDAGGDPNAWRTSQPWSSPIRLAHSAGEFGTKRFSGELQVDENEHAQEVGNGSPALALRQSPSTATLGNAGRLATAIDSSQRPAQLLAHPANLRTVQARVIEKAATVSTESGHPASSTEVLTPHPGGASSSNLRPLEAIEFAAKAAVAPVSEAPSIPEPLAFVSPNQKLPYSANGDEAPTISVTIGRVEVRAIFAPPPLQRPGRPARLPAMSLDEYHKQRGGGGK
jgi:hypothetical protein